MSDNTKVFYSHETAQRRLFSGYCYIESEGSFCYYREGKLHAPFDGEGPPSVQLPNGTQVWHKNGVIHRECGPAYLSQDIHFKYYLEGEGMYAYEYENHPTVLKRNLLLKMNEIINS